MNESQMEITAESLNHLMVHNTVQLLRAYAEDCVPSSFGGSKSSNEVLQAVIADCKNTVTLARDFMKSLKAKDCETLCGCQCPFVYEDGMALEKLIDFIEVRKEHSWSFNEVDLRKHRINGSSLSANCIE